MSAVRSFRTTGFGLPGVTQRSLGIPTAAYPGRIATNSDLIVAVDSQQTALLLPLTPAATSMTVFDASQIVPYNLLSIDNEIVKTTGAAAGNVVPISRGFDGTVAAPHSANAIVAGLVDAWHHNALVSEIEAIETALGPNLSNVSSAAVVSTVTSVFAFPPQTPGGTLNPGTQVIMLAPVPRGVNGTDINHYLYISGGTGAAEAVLITGGTAVSGAASGTVIVGIGPGGHSGAWTIQSATAGIEEALYYTQISPTVGGFGDIVIPAGSWDIYAPIYVPWAKTLRGVGVGITTLLAHQTTQDAITIPASFAGVGFGTMVLKDLAITFLNNPTSGAGVSVATKNIPVILENLFIYNPFVGIALTGTTITLRHIDMQQVRSIGISATHDGVSGAGGQWSDISIFSIPAGASYGILMQSWTDGTNISDVVISGFQVGLFVNGSAVTEHYITNVFIANMFIEESFQNGIRVSGGAGANAGGIYKFVNLRVASVNSPTAAAIQFDAGRFSDINICNLFTYGHPVGILLDGTRDVTIAGSTIHTSSGANTIGIWLNDGSGLQNNNISITGNTIGFEEATGNTTGIVPQYAIFVDSGLLNNRVSITGNTLNGSVASAFLVSVPANFVFRDNVGIDDVIPIVASAASIALPVNPAVKVTGTTTITTMTGGWSGGRVRLVKTDTGTLTVGGGGNIPGTHSLAQNAALDLVFDGTSWF